MNSLQIAFVNREPTPEPDRRYRILVQLVRSDRPKYWVFHCPHCRTKVVELQNQEIYAMTDFYDPQNTGNAALGFRCDGPYCRRYYYFMLN